MESPGCNYLHSAGKHRLKAIFTPDLDLYDKMDAPPVETTVVLTITPASTLLHWDPPPSVDVDEALRNGPQGHLNASLYPASFDFRDETLEENKHGGDGEEEEGGEEKSYASGTGLGLGLRLGSGGKRGWRGLSDVLISYHSDPLLGAQSCHPGTAHRL